MLATPTGRRASRRRSCSSCAVRQHSSSASRLTTACRAPPRRWPAALRTASACSAQVTAQIIAILIIIWNRVFEPFRYPFVQDGLVEVLLLAPAAGLLGTWIVLRGLSFYSHAVAAASFPGLVLADGLGAPALTGAFGAAFVFALCMERIGRARDTGEDSVAGLVLTGALALGVILASDVFHSASSVESLLFGSLLAISAGDQAVAAGASLLVILLGLPLARPWLATGFEPDDARALGVRSRLPELVLLGLVAVSVVAALAATGALLVAALFVVPAATVRLVTRRVLTLQLGAVALAALEGVAGLWLSVEANVPPGAAIAVLSGGVFALVAAARFTAARRVAA